MTLTSAPDLGLPDLGQRRTWHWRGWPIRYHYLRPNPLTTAPPLVLLHGFGASLAQWRNNLAGLSQAHPVYALDLLGFGGSAKAATDFSSQLWAAQVLDFCQQVIGRPVILVGHSLGALVALAATVQQPTAVARLVLLTLPAARQELLSGWVQSVAAAAERRFSSPLLIRPLFSVVRRPRVLRAALKGVYTQPQRVDQALVESFAAPTRDRGSARTLCYLVRSRTDPAFSPDSRELVRQLTVPTLLLWGEDDRVIPLTWGRQIPPLNPQVQLQIVDQVGHCLYDEAPEVVNQAILSWGAG
jgi:pimeloyl-ACP methyl ester carboxylesterase